ncbi:hypothetical protein [Streptomyces beihaiensis]|uniref:Peptidase inhibitor family I36 n=1 Tax=Streptomyces beihaiensis TaxID=2984495 RepID=A0ABT3TMQ6_9ACTN|nr:hypothetical protein [Streptomyces beihaiensis]MCX3058286.1 hypothetical protein [Streptomyces beihaiensis]
MRITRRIAATAAAGALAAGALGLATTPAQAATSVCATSNPPSGSICFHIYNSSTGTWHWTQPWYYCGTKHNFSDYEWITWVKDNQTTGTVTKFYWGTNWTDGVMGTRTAKFYGRPPYYSSDNGGGIPGSPVYSVKIC